MTLISSEPKISTNNSSTTTLNSTTLNENLTDAATNINVTDASSFANSGTIKINGEFISYTGKTTNTLTGCTRGIFGTTVAAHSSNNVVAEVFVGNSEEVYRFTSILITISSNVSSADGGIYIEFSSNNTNWDISLMDSYEGGGNYSKAYDIQSKYYRIIYVNGLTSQSNFRLQSSLNKVQTGTMNVPRVVEFKEPLNDAFSRLRISYPHTLFQVSHNIGKQLDIIDESYVSGGSSNTLSSAIYTTESSISLTDAGEFTNSGKILIDNEVITYTGKSTNTLTGCTRGYHDTISTAHATATSVFQLSSDTSAIHSTNESCIDISVSLTSGDEITRQSRIYNTYQPGKSLLIVLTGVLNSNNNGTKCRSRLGYFDDNNGVYFEYSDDTLSIIKRSKITGSIVNTYIPQNLWNIDKMDGKGMSGIVLHPEKALIYVIDLQWLGVGRIRMGIFVKGNIYYVHQFLHSNTETTTYMTTATLPVRYQITNTSGSNGSGSMKMICASVVCEGGFESIGVPRSIGEITETSISTKFEPLVSIRISSAHSHVLCKFIGLSILSSSNANVIYRVYLFRSPPVDPLTNSSWNTDLYSSVIEYDTSATGLNTKNGHLIYQGFFSNNSDYATMEIERTVYITSNKSNISDMIVLAARTTSGSKNVYGAMNWVEYHT